MSESWFPRRTTPTGRAAGLRRLSRLTAGLSIGAVAATGGAAAAVGVTQLGSSGASSSTGLVVGGTAGGTAGGIGGSTAGGVAGSTAGGVAGGTVTNGGGGGAQVTVPVPAVGSSGLVQAAPPTRSRAHATSGGS